MYIHILFIYICINPNMGDGDWRHGISWDHVEILGSTEKEVHFPGLIKGCNTILQNFRE